MAYFDDPNHASFYSSVSGGIYSYPPLNNQTFAIDAEVANSQLSADPTDPWSMDRRPGPRFGSPTSLRATASFGERHSDSFTDSCLTREPPESVAPTTPYTNRSDGYSGPSYDWSADYQPAQSHYPVYLTRDHSFASTAASETSTAAHTHSSGGYSLEEFGTHRPQAVPLNYWGDHRSGVSTSTPYVVSVRFKSSLHKPANTFP